MKTHDKFYSEFLNLREARPGVVTQRVMDFLDRHKIGYTSLQTRGLLADFFGLDSHVLHIHPEIESSRVLIGKGVCYDSGGYNIKDDAQDMFFDKNGAINVIATAIQFKQPAIVFFVNNMVSKDAIVPGTVLHDPFSKLGVYIHDTDAEGRIGLAHCLGVAESLGYTDALTVATLTGAACGVTGDETYALIHSNNHNDYVKIMTDTLNGAKYWPAPFHKAYDSAVISHVIGADVDNLGSLRRAGSSTAFSFLKRFFSGHLIHLDIAGFCSDKDHNAVKYDTKDIKRAFDLLQGEVV